MHIFRQQECYYDEQQDEHNQKNQKSFQDFQNLVSVNEATN
jgi:hypothetical protein